MLTFATGDNFIFIWMFNRISPLMKHFYFCVKSRLYYDTHLQDLSEIVTMLNLCCLLLRSNAELTDLSLYVLLMIY